MRANLCVLCDSVFQNVRCESVSTCHIAERLVAAVFETQSHRGHRDWTELGWSNSFLCLNSFVSNRASALVAALPRWVDPWRVLTFRCGCGVGVRLRVLILSLPHRFAKEWASMVRRHYDVVLGLLSETSEFCILRTPSTPKNERSSAFISGLNHSVTLSFAYERFTCPGVPNPW